MKQLIIIAGLLFLSVCVSAQDLLITQEGNVIKAYETEIGPSSVFYKASEDPAAPLQKMQLSDILVIKFKDGSTFQPGAQQPAVQAVAPAPAPAEAPAAAPVPAGGASNPLAEQAISEFNGEQVQYSGERNGKTAKILFCQCKLMPGSVILDENVELHFASTTKNYSNQSILTSVDNALKITVKNKSNSMIYVDLGNSFFQRGSESQVMYVPAVTSSGTSSSSGASVNLGALTRSPVLGGVTVGGGSTNTTTTTVYAQRVIAVPPMAQTDIGSFIIFQNKKEACYAGHVKMDFNPWGMMFPYVGLNLYRDDFPEVGEEKALYDENIRFGTYITYATDEELTNPRQLNAFFCLDKIIGGKLGSASQTINMKNFSPNYRKTVFFIADPNSNF